MITTRQQIINAVVSLLTSQAPEGFPAIQPARVLSTQDQSFPNILVYRASETESVMGSRNAQAVKRELRFKVHIRVAAFLDTDATPEELTEPYLEFCSSTLSGQHLGGLVTNLTHAQTDWSLDISDVGICEAIAEFVAEYVAPRNTTQLM